MGSPSGNMSSDSCRGGSKLQNEYLNIKMRQELTSEMSKMQCNLKFSNDHDRVDNCDAMSFGNLKRTYLPTKRHLLRIFVIDGFLIN